MIELRNLLDKLQRMADNPESDETFPVAQAVHRLAIEISEVRKEVDFIFRHLVRLQTPQTVSESADTACVLNFEDIEE